MMMKMNCVFAQLTCRAEAKFGGGLECEIILSAAAPQPSGAAVVKDIVIKSWLGACEDIITNQCEYHCGDIG